MSNTAHARPRKPAPAAKPAEVFDLDALPPAGEPFKFVAGGQEFEMPHMGDLDYRVTLGLGPDGLRAGQELLKEALGDQWADFESKRLTVSAWRGLQQAWAKHSGVETSER